jgi:hypothetical protein
MLEFFFDNVDVGDIFACGGSIVYKYTLLIFHALADKNKLLRNYISIFSGARLQISLQGNKHITLQII